MQAEPSGPVAGSSRLHENSHTRRAYMSVTSLIKTTLVCSLIAFVVYSVPAVGQVVIIGVLGLLWLSCAHQTFRALLRKRPA